MDERDMSMLRYFWKEKGDVRKYNNWDKIQEDLKRDHAGLWYALNQYYTMESIIDSLLEDF